MRLIRDGEKKGKGVWRRGKREIIIYTYRYTAVSTGMTYALRWAAIEPF